METLIKIFEITILVAAILLCLVLICWLLRKLIIKKRVNAIIEEPKRTPSFVPRLLKAQFPDCRIFRNAILPEPLENGLFGKGEADLIKIDTCGIVVMALCPYSGAIDNPENGDWTVSGPNGNIVIPNPFEKNTHAIRALAEILNEEEVYNCPIFSVAVFYGKKPVFRYKNKKILTTETLLPTLIDMNREKILSGKEIKNAESAIRKYVPKPAKAAKSAHNKAVRK